MWHELDRRQQALLDQMRSHAALCDRPVPDRAAITASRWRIAQAARMRMDYLTGTALPLAERLATPAERAHVVALRDATPAYQRRVSAYVSRWPIEAILARWSLYIVESQQLRADINARIAAEVGVMRPILLRAVPAAKPVPLPVGQDGCAGRTVRPSGAPCTNP